MKITKGTIFRNMHHPDYEIYLVYLFSKGNSAYCIKVAFNKFNESQVSWNCNMWKTSLENDRQLFPIVGHIDVDDLVMNHVLNEISRAKKAQKSTTTGDEYDEQREGTLS